MNATTTHSSEVVGQLVLIEADPIRQRVKHAVAGFLADYSGITVGAYRLELRGLISRLTPPDSIRSRSSEPTSSCAPLVRVRGQGSINDRKASLDDLRLQPVLRSGADHRA